MTMKHTGITIRDVARLAGVSHQTVSRVINDKSEIRPDTRQRVLQAMQELGYRPSRIAQSMNTRRTFTVGMVIPSIANPYFSEMVRGVQNFAEARGYNVFLANTDWNPTKEKQMLYSLADHSVDGVILCSARLPDEDLIAFAERHGPLVLSGRHLHHRGISLVEQDHDQGGQVAVEHLVQQGHTCIGVLTGPSTPPTMSNALRALAIIRAIRDCGLQMHEEWIVPGEMNPEGGYQSTRWLLPAHPEITALICHNDLVAIGAMHACRELGLRVPQDCAVVGHNDISLAAMVNPPITTVRVDRYKLGQELMRRALKMVDDPEGDHPPLILPVDGLIKRESA